MGTIASGTDSVTSESGVTVSSIIIESYSAALFSNQSFTYAVQGKKYKYLVTLLSFKSIKVYFKEKLQRIIC